MNNQTDSRFAGEGKNGAIPEILDVSMFKGKANTEEILWNKADYLAHYVNEKAKNDRNDFLNAVNQGSFDPTDFKLKRYSSESEAGRFFWYELIYFYYYLISRQVASHLGFDKMHTFSQDMLEKFFREFQVETPEEKKIVINQINPKLRMWDEFPNIMDKEKPGNGLIWRFGEEIKNEFWSDGFGMGAFALQSLVVKSLVSFNVNDLINSAEEKKQDELSEKEKLLLQQFIKTTTDAENQQLNDLIQNCNISYQFAKTHSAYVKDWEKTKHSMEQMIENNRLPEGVSVKLMIEMAKEGEKIIQAKLEKVRNAFQIKFNESIYNYIGKDGKTKKLFGIF